jgi:cullin-4
MIRYDETQKWEVRNIFLYLDRLHVLHTDTKSLWDLGVQLFRDALVAHQGEVIARMVVAIDLERDGKPLVDSDVLATLAAMLRATGLMSSFETALMAGSEAYFRRESSQKDVVTVSEYLHAVVKRVDDEKARFSVYADNVQDLLAVVRQELFGRHVQDLLDRGFREFVQQGRLTDIERLWSLCTAVGARDVAVAAWAKVVKFIAEAAIADDPKSVIGSLLAVRKQLGVVVDSLNREDALVARLKEGFEDVVGRGKQTEIAHMLARYIDTLFKEGLKARVEDEFEQTLDLCMHVFRALHAKDIFEAFYRKDLAKRLLLSKAPIELEMTLIQRLRADCGSSFTNKMQGMLKDMCTSDEVFRQFSAARRKGPPGAGAEADDGFEFAGQVLTAASWPTYEPVDVALPASVAALNEEFASFYKGLHSGRNLQFACTFGTCHLRMSLRKEEIVRKWEIVVSHCQAVVLLLFNTSDVLEFDFVQQATKLPQKDLRAVFFSLCNPKYKLVNKPDACSRKDADRKYALNKDFAYPKLKLSIPSAQAKETQEEVDETKERVFEDRIFQVDAAIVRIMKSRKRLRHNDLIQELFRILQFEVEVADLKKRIENLLERDYLERDPSDLSFYNYLP